MPADYDPQRQDELSRQRGYGEQPKKGKRAVNQQTHTAGYKKTDETEDTVRVDTPPVTSLRDELVPNVPKTANADTGPKDS